MDCSDVTGAMRTKFQELSTNQQWETDAGHQPPAYAQYASLAYTDWEDAAYARTVRGSG